MSKTKEYSSEVHQKIILLQKGSNFAHFWNERSKG